MNTDMKKIAREMGLSPGPNSRNGPCCFPTGQRSPFIARYRKEVTGSLDEVAVTTIRDRLLQLEELEARREAILKSLTERNLLTDDLRGGHCRCSNPGRPGGYLPSLPPETPDQGHCCTGKRTGAAGHANF